MERTKDRMIQAALTAEMQTRRALQRVEHDVDRIDFELNRLVGEVRNAIQQIAHIFKEASSHENRSEDD